MKVLTGTLELVRLDLRRDRVRIAVWVISIPLLILVTALSVKSLFPTQAAIDQAALATQHNPGAIAFNGPAQGLHTLGGQVAFQAGAFGMVVVALMSIFMVGRLTRGDEEAGRVELLRSLPAGVLAPAAAALVTAMTMNVLVTAAVAAALLGTGLPQAGSLVLAISLGATGLFFAGAALVAAQLTENTRVVSGSGVALVALAYLVRIVGDIGDGRLSWLSPIGMAQKARPYAGERWWPLLPLVGAGFALIVAGLWLALSRDLGSGLVAPRPGRARAAPSLGSPLGLAARLQRGSLLGWGAGVVVTGVAYGWIAPTIDSFVRGNKELAQLLAAAGRGSLTDMYFATALRILALLVTGFAVQSALRLRAEETSLRAEPVLAAPVSRWRWAASHLALAAGGSAVLLAAGGLATGLSYAGAGGQWSTVPRLIAAALVYAPAVWSIMAFANLLFGLAPRLVDVAWAVFAACFVWGLLGDVLRLPGWLLNLSPFERTPALPAARLSVEPVAALLAVAVAMMLVGLALLRRRDIG